MQFTGYILMSKNLDFWTPNGWYPQEHLAVRFPTIDDIDDWLEGQDAARIKRLGIMTIEEVRFDDGTLGHR